MIIVLALGLGIIALLLVENARLRTARSDLLREMNAESDRRNTWLKGHTEKLAKMNEELTATNSHAAELLTLAHAKLNSVRADMAMADSRAIEDARAAGVLA